MSSLRSRRAAIPTVETSITMLGATQDRSGAVSPGGLDLVTPSLAMRPGTLTDCQNFECSISGGYSRIKGYERFDGRPAPSAAVFVIVQVSSFSVVPSVGDAISQAGSGATGTVAAVSNVADAYYMAVTKVSGTFNETGVVSQVTSTFTVTAANSPFTVTASNSPFTVPYSTVIGTATTTTVGLTSQEQAQYTNAAADIYRADITKVPGSGAVRGVVAMTFSGADYVYAFRDNEAGTQTDIYRSSASGWTQVALFKSVAFTTGGTATPSDGATVTQGAVTATLKRAVTRTGAWSSGTAAGELIVDGMTGGKLLPGAATISGGIAVTLTAEAQQIVITAGERVYEFDKGNFSGQSRTRRIYGCDGVNKAFEFDGTVYVPITTGLATDAPSHIYCHKNYLVVAYEGSLLLSDVGFPYRWITGTEIATGDTITGMVSAPGAPTTATLLVYQRTNTCVLYGLTTADFNFTVFNAGTGAIAGSIQNLFDTFVFDDFGVITLQASLQFGNFSASTLTKNILPLIQRERGSLSTSTISRGKSQYRVFFSDGYGIWLTVVNQAYVGAALVYFPNPVICCDTQHTSDNEEVSYFGSTDGYVYQMEKGTSFDGADIDAWVTLAWDPLRSPRLIKQWRGASIEISSNTYAAVSLSYSLGYGDTSIGQPTPTSYSSSLGGAPLWDAAGVNWDASFVWDGQTLTPTEAPMVGLAVNVQVTIAAGTDYIDAFQLNSIVYHATPRRQVRV